MMYERGDGRRTIQPVEKELEINAYYYEPILYKLGPSSPVLEAHVDQY